MKKGKSRHKRKKSRLLWIAIAVIGMAAITVAVCVAGMFKKEDVWKTPEELLVEYMNHIPAQEYEQMYAMLHIEASGNVSQEDFIKRNSAIYEGIEIQNMAVEIIAYDEEQLTVTYQTSFDTVAGEISFENEAFFLEGEDGYKLVWDDSLIFPNLASTDNIIKPYLIYESEVSAEYWISGAFSSETASRVLEGTKKVVNDSHGTGYAAHRDDIVLAGKTGTAEIKASKDDTSGTELGWFAVFTAEETVERPILIISMVEDVKGRGGSGYVVKKDSLVLEEWFSRN